MARKAHRSRRRSSAGRRVARREDPLRRYQPLLAALLVALFLLLAAAAHTGPIANNDYGLHLRIGSEIAATGRPVRIDNHAHTLPDAPYPDHEWLTQWAFYGLRGMLEEGGMVVLKGLLVGTALLLLALALRERPLPLRLLLLLAVFLLALDHSHMRPHLLSWVWVALLVLLLERRWWWAVPPLLLLWANSHGSVLLGVGWVLLHFGELYWQTRERRILVWSAVCALLPLLNPNGWGIYTLFFQIGGHTAFIGEWQPYRPDNGPFWLLVGLFGFGLYGLLRAERFRFFDALRLLALAVLAFQSSRNGVVAAILLAPMLGRWYGEGVARWSPRLRLAFSVVAVGVVGLALGLRLQAGKALRFELDHQQLPVEALAFVREQGIEGPIFNDYNFGGYLLWRGWPDYPVFVDGRTEVYRGPVLEEYLEVSRAKPGWQQIVERYGVTFFMVRPEREISSALLGHEGWELVYFDYNAAVYLRAGLFPQVRRLEVVSPYGHRDPQAVEQAIDEISYLLRQNPRFFGGYKILAFLRYRQGAYDAAREALYSYLALHPEGIDVAETQELIEALEAVGAWP